MAYGGAVNAQLAIPSSRAIAASITLGICATASRSHLAVFQASFRKPQNVACEIAGLFHTNCQNQPDEDKSGVGEDVAIDAHSPYSAPPMAPPAKIPRNWQVEQTRMAVSL
ncbi:hypothetical protein [Acidiferrobacter sp.]|uniref:hypothetical protein n=1 Tax=Acidiferrobacter sp. TaxID=1872107 RepID=UPI00261C47BA|nr:hypothetical protein [Acidiferrobacter sp.]